MTAWASPDYLLVWHGSRAHVTPLQGHPDMALVAAGLWRIGPWQPIRHDSAWTASARVEGLEL